MSRDLQYAYRYFNNALFGGTLPANIVLSYQRDSATFACFRQRQYLHVSRRVSHAIAINPQYLALRTLTESLASLVHAMCRLAHGEFGRRKSRSSYHNRELANVLKRVGLLPRVDGDPNGKETGHRVGHIIEDDGPFDLACRKLLADGFSFAWVDRIAPALPYDATPEQARAKRLDAHAEDAAQHLAPLASPGPETPQPPPRLPDPAYARLQGVVFFPEPSPTGRRRKYECQGCKKSFYGSRDIEAKCVPCDRYFVDTDPESLKYDTPKRRKLREVRHQARVARPARPRLPR